MAKRTDSNQAEIVRMLRDFGASVTDLHEVGHGCPDIIVGYGGVTYPMEIKSAGGQLTEDEYNWQQNWRGNYHIIHNIEEALQVLCDGAKDYQV